MAIPPSTKLLGTLAIYVMELKTQGLVSVAENLISTSKSLPANLNPDKSGGFLTVVLDDFSRIFILEVGTYDTVKKDKYIRFSQEKAYRLYSDWLRNPSETVSSWQSRQPEIDRYGGAVLFDNPRKGLHSLVSFSGLNELTDEAISLMMGDQLDLKVDVERVIGISNNEVYRQMRNYMKRNS
ncbi:hypothetical protein HYT57_05555 [Candidatus Woesearchaeota archaeon]|nr:hypothetical protein [Candidatus Woesearchaeota archaeon]